jgi:hypothetical protein
MVLWLTLYVRPMSVNALPAFRRAIASDWIWSGIVACIVQFALFSGLNLAVFSLAL